MTPFSSGQRVAPEWRAVPGMSAVVEVDGPGLIEIQGHVGFQIEDKRCDQSDKFMLGIALEVDGRLVRAPIGTQATENEIRDTHYHDAVFTWTLPVEPGLHRIEVLARAKVKRAERGCAVYFKERQYHGAVVKVYG
jgi:hypothetical protein